MKTLLTSIEPLEQRIAPASFVVTSSADLGSGTLREAILAANRALGADTITFDLPDEDRTISLRFPLPDITGQGGLVIDATSERNSFGGVILDGRFAGPGTDGLRVVKTSASIIGLTIQSFGGDGIEARGNIFVKGCYIGTDSLGTLDLGNGGSGIHLLDTSNATIGGFKSYERNVISGNDLHGIAVETNVGKVTVLGNYIGTSASGREGIGNSGDGIWLAGSSYIIGGSDLGAGNLISGNELSGIRVAESKTPARGSILGNKIGTNDSGASSIANGIGITLEVGGQTIGGPGLGRNVISGNLSHGIYLNAGDSERTMIVNNSIGIRPEGGKPNGNGGDGIFIRSSNGVQIGQSSMGNVISGNSGHGIEIFDSSNSVILGNRIGTDAKSSFSTSNLGDGIFIHGRSISTTIGAVKVGNVISGNEGNGIRILDSIGTQITGNQIGTDQSGLNALGNAGDGIHAESGSSTVILSNVISGNESDGLDLRGQGYSVAGNKIGTDMGGQRALPNHGVGVRVFSTGDSINIGEVNLPRNVISGNGSHGIWIEAGSARVVNNHIGVDTFGIRDLGNGGHGIFVMGLVSGAPQPSFYIGNESDTEPGNVISGNAGDGISVQGTARADRIFGEIYGNVIGLNALGSAAIGNDGDGISVRDARVRIGSEESGSAANVISGNSGNGIQIEGFASIFSNLIGTDATGLIPIGNAGSGIVLHVTNDQQQVSGNVIAASGQHGIDVRSGPGILILDNRIGVGADGITALGNTGDGIVIRSEAHSAYISAADYRGVGNIIAANGGNGISILGSQGTRVLANQIGLLTADHLPLGNRGHGIYIENAHGTEIKELFEENTRGNSIVGNGGSGIFVTGSSEAVSIMGNTITRNAGPGVAVVGESSSEISRNSIFSNGGLDIDLGNDGITQNDPLDADSGPNSLQNTASLRFAGAYVRGTFNGAPDSTFRLELFSNVDREGDGHQDSQAFIREVLIQTDSNGRATLVEPLDPLPAGSTITATSTALSDANTSEFSLPVEVRVVDSIYAVSHGKGGAPMVQIYDADSATLRAEFLAFESSFRGGVRVATGDVNGDGHLDAIAASGPGRIPMVKVFDGLDGHLLKLIIAKSGSSAAGAFVATADLDGDARAEIIVSTERKDGAPRVHVYSGEDGLLLNSFGLHGKAFADGVAYVAAGDLDGDGRAEIVVSSAHKAGHVRVLDGETGTRLHDWSAFRGRVPHGVNIAVGDVTGDGISEIIISEGRSGFDRISAFDATGEIMAKYRFPHDRPFDEIRVAALDIDGDGIAEILTSSRSEVRSFNTVDSSNTALPPALTTRFPDGLYIA